MLVVVNFAQLDEDQHTALKSALDAHASVKDWFRFFGHSYIVNYASAEGSLAPLYELCKRATMKDDKQAYVALNPLYKGYAGCAPKDLWDFIAKNAGAGAGTLAHGVASPQEKNPHLVSALAQSMSQQPLNGSDPKIVHLTFDKV